MLVVCGEIKMKKWMVWLFVFVLFMVLVVGCGGDLDFGDLDDDLIF